MTRQGTLAYYLAAWVIGCFVVSLLAWLLAVIGGQPARASTLLMTYFFGLIFGAADALLFAFLLRRMMRWCKTHMMALWLLAGAGLGFALILLLSEANDAWINFHGPMNGTIAFFLSMFLAAPDALRHASLWPVPIEGGAIGVVLCLVDRAFNPQDGHGRLAGAPPPPVHSSAPSSTGETKHFPV